MAQTIQARSSTAKTKGQVKQLRREGYVTIGLQHKGEETMHLEAAEKEVTHLVSTYGEATVFEVIIQPGNLREKAVVHGVQRDPLTRKIIHATFQKISTGDSVKTHIPIAVHGEPESVRLGDNTVHHPIDQIEVRCAPDKLPDHITIEIGALEPFGTLRVSDLPPIEGVQILTPPDTVIVSLMAQAAGEPAASAAPATA